MSSQESPRKKIRIIGAGFSGLTCAYYLVKAGFEVEIYEKSERAGGLLQSFKTPYGMLEYAANGLLNSEALETMASDIGLSLNFTLEEARVRYIYRNGIKRFPIRAVEFFALSIFLFKMIFMRKSILPKNSESIRSWGSRMLSPSLSLYTLETALQGIYAGDPVKMSASLILKNFFEGPRTKVKRGSVAPQAGMSELVEKLQQYLLKNGVQFFYKQELQFKELQVPTVFAIPAYEAAKCLEVLDPHLAQTLARIEYLPVISAQVFFSESSESLKAFGCLFPPEKSNLVLGVLFNHCIFAGRVKNAKSEKWILGGGAVQNRKEFLALSDHEILNLVLERRRLLIKEFKDKPLSELIKAVLDVKISRIERAFPNYSVELESTLRGLKSENRNIVLHGNYLGELGLTKLLERSARIAKQIKLLNGAS